jgi:hypothetical protein
MLLGVLPAGLIARAMPPGSNFRLNIDFLRERKIVTGEIFLRLRAPGKNFLHPAIFAVRIGK